jgi:hypothetical protein
MWRQIKTFRFLPVVHAIQSTSISLQVIICDIQLGLLYDRFLVH